MRSGTELSQFLRVFLSTLLTLNGKNLLQKEQMFWEAKL